MKAEPLKGKRIKPFDPNFFPNDYFFMMKDVKLAVGWLMKNLNECPRDTDIEHVKMLVEKAFEDVVKK